MNNNTCSNTLECNINTTIAKICFTDGFCRCSSAYGFDGENCTEVTGKLVFFRVLNAILIILGALLTLAHIILIGKVVYLKKEREKVVKRVWAIIFLSFCSSVTSLVASSLRNISFYDSSIHKLIRFTEIGITTEIIAAETDFFTYKLWTTDFCLGILLSNLIVLSWFNIIKKVSEVFPDVLAKRERYLAIFLTFYIPFFSFLLILSLILNDEKILFNLILLTINNFLFILLFIWLTIYVLKPIKEQISTLNTSKSSNMFKAINLISFTLKVIVILGLLNVFSTMFGAIAFQLYPNNPTEGLGTLTNFIEVFVALNGLFYSSFGLWYIFGIISRNYHTKRKKTSVQKQ